MNAEENDRLQRLVNTLLRQPEAVDDIDARRALTRLTAARPDAAYLLLQRALVLELALERVKAHHAQHALPNESRQHLVAGPAAVDATADSSTPRALRRPSPFVRDAATIAAGVVAGGLVLGGLGALGDSLAGDDGMGMDIDMDLGLDDWI